MVVVHYYRKTEPPHSLLPSIQGVAPSVTAVETESCFNVLQEKGWSAEETARLEWLLAETFDKGALRLEESFLSGDVMEFGPRLTFTSAFSSNATSICQQCGLEIARLELSRRYRFVASEPLSEETKAALRALLHDRMTEQEYTAPLQSFDSGAQPQPVRTIPIMSEGRAALEKLNAEMGLGFDDFDLDYYTNLFKVRLSSVCRRGSSVFGSNASLTSTVAGETRSRSHRRRVL